MTGRSRKIIASFMCRKRNSVKTAIAIKKALNIKETHGFEERMRAMVRQLRLKANNYALSELFHDNFLIGVKDKSCKKKTNPLK